MARPVRSVLVVLYQVQARLLPVDLPITSLAR